MDEKQKFFQEFNNSLHRLGRMTMILMIGMLLLVPVTFGMLNDLSPDWSAFLKGIVTVGILGGIICCIFFLKGYLNKLKAKPKKESSGKPGFGAHATTAMFVGLCATFVGSYVGKAVHEDVLPLIVAVIAGAVMAVFEYFIQKKGKAALENFSLAASMLIAMACAVGFGMIL